MRPYEQLPFPHPSEFNPGPVFFYKNFVKPFIPDMLRMMNVGLPIDDEAVEALRVTIDEVLGTVDERLNSSQLIMDYRRSRLPAARKAQYEQHTTNLRTVADFERPFNNTDMLHRTFIVNEFLKNTFKEKDCKDKWTMQDLKKYNIWAGDPFLRMLIEKEVKPDHRHARWAMKVLAEFKLFIWNKPRYEKANAPTVMQPFNPGSPKQKLELFAMLNILPLAFSKDTGDASWGRDQLEELQRVYGDNKEIQVVLGALVDHSYSAIIKNNFLKAFDSYTIDGVLHGNIKLFGAKSFRNTCLVGNTKVHSSLGLVEIKDIKPNDLLLTTDSSYQPVIRVFDNGLSPVFKITLEDGSSVVGTSNHRFLTEAGYLSIESICNVETVKRSTINSRANPSVMEGKPFVVSSRYGESVNTKKGKNTQNTGNASGAVCNKRKEAETLSYTNRRVAQGTRTKNTRDVQEFGFNEHGKHSSKFEIQPQVGEPSFKQKLYEATNTGQKYFEQKQREEKIYFPDFGTTTRDEEAEELHNGWKRVLIDAYTSLVGKIRKHCVCSSSSYVRSPRFNEMPNRVCSTPRKRGQNRQQNRQPSSFNKRSTFKTASGSSRIKHIEYMGIERVYDVEVKTNHCYLANGIWSHNSNSPNLLNAPSTGSIYAKPLKRCFKAADGCVIYTADLSALEDRVIANLSGDTNKQNIFLQGLDGHSLNACGYYPKQIEKIMGVNEDNVEYVKRFKENVDEGNSLCAKFRQDSKGPTFKLAYGGYPDASKGGVITQEIFDNYHNILYPGITRYREEYVLPSTKRNGYIHLGLGCIMYSSNPASDIRTLNNATVQFWSILTLIAINEFNYRIDEAGYSDYIKVSSTIYDSIYVQVIRDPLYIAWVNNNLIELMCVQYLEDEVIHNEASGEIGLNWADLHPIANNASVEEIAEVLRTL